MKIILNENQDFETLVIKELGVDINSELFEDLQESFDEDIRTLDVVVAIDFENDELLKNHGVEIIEHHDEDINAYSDEKHGNESDVAESIYNEYIGDSKLEESFGAYILQLIKTNLPYMKG